MIMQEEIQKNNGKGKNLLFDDKETLVSIMRKKAKEIPEHPFLIYKNRTFSYREADEISDRIAGLLVAQGIVHEDAVGIMIGRSELMFLYSMAVMKAGGTYMPLDSHFPEERLLFMCEEADVKLILTEGTLVKKLMPSYDGKVITREELSWAFEGEEGAAYVEFPEVKADDRMVILYTSGSTGKPKGVELEQHGIVNFCHWYVDEFEMTEKDRAAAYANYGFDAHMIDLYPTMLAGASVYILDEEIRTDLVRMNKYLEDNKISIAFMTTQIGCLIKEMNHSFRVLSTGGEKMPPVQPADFRFLNVYGPTECSLFSTFYDVKGYFEGEYIGKPLANYELYVVDKNLKEVPFGTQGELLIAGTGVARGYLNRPDLTAEKFIEFNGKRAYRSGDLVKWSIDPRDKSEQIEFLGRIDNQVKLRGLRIELGEIENRVANYAGIRQACVDVKEIKGAQNLVCYYVAQVGTEISESNLKQWLIQSLPAFMVPEIYVHMEELPLTPNGKINRKALPVPELTLSLGEILPPKTETEKVLFNLAAKLLTFDQFGINTSLLSLGLTSLTAMRLSAIIQQETGIHISSGDIIGLENIRAIAEAMDAGKKSFVQIAGIHEYQEYYPLSENQRGLYVDWTMDPSALQYNLPFVKEIKGYTSKEVKDALIRVVNAHPVLKMRVGMRDGDALQHRRDEAEVTVSVTRITEEPEAAFFQSRVRPFDLHNDDLYRFEVYESGEKVYLFMDIHHIVYDGGSTFVFFDELFRALRGESLKGETYTAFDRALDEKEMSGSDAYENAEAYFGELLSEYAEAEYPKSDEPDSKETGVARVKSVIKGGIVGAFCRENGVTESSFFMTIVTQALHRILREDKLLITSITNGRMTNEMQNIIGMFVQTLPVVTSAAGNKTVKEAALEMQKQYIRTQENSIYPYTKIVEKFGTHSKIMFAFQGGAGAILSEEDYRSKYQVTTGSAIFPIAIQVFPIEGNYEIEIEYDPSLYSGKDMQKLTKIFRLFAENAACHAETPFSQVSLISDREKETLKILGTGKLLEYDKSETLIDLFRKKTSESPDHTFLVYKEKSYTYKETDRITNRIAKYLVSRGLQKEQAVGVMIGRSELMFIYSMAVMKAGGTYMPLDSHFPEERLLYMCKDADVRLILTEGTLVKELMPSYDGEVITREELSWAFNEEEKELPGELPRVYANDRMVILYTSGSTGKPKGVELEHHSIVNCARWYVNEFEMTEKDRAAAYANYGFDAHMIDLYPTMLAGASLYILDEDIRTDLVRMNEYLELNKINVAIMTTQIACLIKDINHSFRVLAAGGEKMPPVKPVDFRFINAYGPTECTVFSTIYDVKGYFEGEYIGKPIANYELYIVDKNMKQVPFGTPGELLVTGDGVARGYLNRPELTKEKFVEFEEQRAYRTGDLVKWSVDPRDGSEQIEFLGRIDNQVKLRGLRIELGEIENRVAHYNGIRQVCVDVKKVGGGQNLVCYYTGDYEIDQNKLKEWIGETLAAFMVPEIYIHMEELPLTPNGKIDRKALPVPELNLSFEEIIAPENDVETQLFEIAARLLGHDQFGVTTNLLSVGLTSLTAMRYSAMIAQETGKNLQTKYIMTSPTIRELSVIFTEENQAENTQIANIHEYQEYYPLAENQRGVYADWEMNREALQYNIPMVQVIRNHTPQEVKEALEKVINAHPVLKAQIELHNGDVVQRRCDEKEPVVTVTEVAEEPDRDFFQSKVLPFDLFRDRLYRMELIVSPTKLYWFSDIHHIVYDGGSTAVFTENLKKALEGKEIIPETYTAFDRALDEEEMRGLKLYESASAYFKELLSEYEVASYPHSNNGNTKAAGVAHVEKLILKDAIEHFCKKNAITENSFFLTVITQALHKILREEKLLINSVTSGRVNEKMQDIVGMFVQTLPVVTKASEKSAIEEMKTMQEQYIHTQEHSIYSYTKIVENYGVHAEILFVYQGGIGVDLYSSEDSFVMELDNVKMPITIMVYPKGDQYVVDIEYDKALYTRTDMKYLADSFGVLALNAVRNPEETMKKLSMVSDEEVEKLKVLGTGKHLYYDKQETLVDILRRKADEIADYPFIVYKEKRYSYGETDRITDRIAEYLVSIGLQKEQAVGVMIGRSELMFIYSMAVMKAGGTYMPLDSHFPEERLLYMCKDADVRLILTEGTPVKELMPSYDGEVITREELSWAFNEEEKELPEELPRVCANDRMVILYTSGSTGKPKGVELEQHGIVNFCHWYVDEYEMTEKDRAAAYANYGFDAHMIDLYPTMLAGASLYILDEDIRTDLVRMNEYLEENEISIAFMTTQIGCLIKGMNHSLRVLSTGGEKMPPVQPADFRFLNVYGPTECSLFSTFYDVKGYFEGEYIGKPIANYELYIIDKNMKQVPFGIQGELLVTGTGVARGYLNRPELTKEKFVEFEGQRAYRTGDLVKWSVDLRDGSEQIEFLGRIDNQVKLRGLRIELGEIENRAAGFDGIRQVCVDVKEVGGSQNLVCYYTADQMIDTEKLKKWIGESLADFMVPEIFISLEKLPLTPNGKVDRRSLPIPKIQDASMENIPPESERENTLYEIVCELLGHSEFGVTDGLKEIGMTSLMAIRMAAMAKEKGITIKAGDILTRNTIRNISKGLMAVASWYQPFDEKKPVMILVSGIFAVRYNQPRMKRWCKNYNILVIEPINAHYRYVFEGGEDYMDIVGFYYDLIDYYVPENIRISGFFGLCLGGVIAYSLANMYHQRTGHDTKVILGDSTYQYDKYAEEVQDDMETYILNAQEILYKILKSNHEKNMNEEEFERNAKEEQDVFGMLIRLGYNATKGIDLQPFEGDVLLFNCTVEKDKNSFPALWRELVSKLTVVDVAAEHHAFCMDVNGKWLDTVVENVLNFLKE